MNAHTQNENTAALVGTIEEDRHELVAINPYERMMETIINRGGDMTALKDMMDLRDRWEATEARKAFNVAFAHFKAEAITVIKGTLIKDGPLKGKMHANLHDVVVATAAPLAKFGLTTAWKLTKDEPANMEVTCVLKHSSGHSETVSMSAAPDTGPGRNAIQARGSTKSYLERYTLMAILGLAASDQDDDGNGAHPQDEPARISEEQEATLSGLIASTDSSLPKYLEWLKIDKLSDLRASSYGRALALLKTKQGIIDKKDSEA